MRKRAQRVCGVLARGRLEAHPGAIGRRGEHVASTAAFATPSALGCPRACLAALWGRVMPPLVVLENVLQALTAGLLMGSIYGLMCVGLGLIYGVMRVINFAQGDFLMLGMYATLYLFNGPAKS